MIKKIDNDRKCIDDYLTQVYNKKPIYDSQRWCQIKYLLGKTDCFVIVSQNYFIKKLARILKKTVYDYEDILGVSSRMLAFRDGLYYLSKKKIPVFFYHRVDKMEGFKYSKTAVARVKDNRSFPKMYQNIQLYVDDFKELLGEKYSENYVNELGKIPQVVKIGNKYCHEDFKSSYINIVDGLRVTPFQPNIFSRTLHVYGRCGVFGYAVEDEDCFPAQVQKILVQKECKDIKVVNHGLWGGDDEMLDHNFLYELQDYSVGDMVLFYRHHFDPDVMKWLGKFGLIYEDKTREWHSYPDSSWCFYDKPGHMNNVGYRNLAKIICEDLLKKQYQAREYDMPSVGVKYLHDYLEINEDIDFEGKIKEYIESVINRKPRAIDGNNGAIVMNCNPFTYGHRYLIEHAAKEVDWLFIFVVEENRSYFEFEDRFKMVVDGTSDIQNVIVVPSGKFMISSYTFPEYFMKDYVKEKNFDVSNDINIFCKDIAPKLGIKYRFAGEEPLDPVTANYNETMKKILPEYDMKFIEVPRKTLDDSQIINATIVRKFIDEKDIDSIRNYIPETTYKIVKEKYL